MRTISQDIEKTYWHDQQEQRFGGGEKKVKSSLITAQFANISWMHYTLIDIIINCHSSIPRRGNSWDLQMNAMWNRFQPLSYIN